MNFPRRVGLFAEYRLTGGRRHAETDLWHEPEPGRLHRRARRRPRLERAERRAVPVVVRPGGATGMALYGRKLWETMSSHWPTADQQPGATPADIEFAHRWRDMPKVVFSSTTSTVDWNTRLVTGDAVTEITRLKAEDGGPID